MSERPMPPIPEGLDPEIVEKISGGLDFCSAPELKAIVDGLKENYDTLVDFTSYMFDRVADLVPGGVERLGRFLPRKPARPTGQKQHVGVGQLMLAVAPGNFLDDHGLAAAAIDPAHRIQQENQIPPERDEFEAPLGQLIVTRRRLMAPGTDRRRTLARTHGELDAFVIGTEAGMLVNEAPEMMTAV